MEQPKDDELLDEEQIIDLPERLNMSLVSTNLGLPINGIVGGNLLTHGSGAQASGVQDAPVDEIEP